MSRKVMDAQGRWRSKTVSLRMSPEENALLSYYAKLSGMTKQDYMIARLLQKEIVVQGNPRVYKALRHQLEALLLELQQIKSADHVEPEWMDRLEFALKIMEGLHEQHDASKQKSDRSDSSCCSSRGTVDYQ